MDYTNKDKFGFYQVGEFKTYSKVDAIEISLKTGNSVHWNFNNLDFSTYNWKIEPVESLRDLYHARARQIRERYDYVVIWWSGGADSFTVLKSFLDQDLFVDEIATFHNYEGDGSWDSYLNSEVKRVAMPVAEQVLEKSPNTKFRLVDHLEYQKDLFKIDNNKFDFLYKCNAVFSPNQLARRYIREREKDYLDLFAQGKRVCFVWGMDKPRVDLEANGKYALRFIDIVDNSVNPVTQQLNRDWEHDEFFYWSPDAKDLLCKQGHVIKNYLRNVPDADFNSKWLTTKPNVLGKTPGIKKWFLTNAGCHRLVYPDWNPDTYSSGKHDFLLMWSPRDEWFLKDSNTEHTKIYTNGLEKLDSIVGKDWVKLGGIKRGLKPCMSIPYYLE